MSAGYNGAAHSGALSMNELVALWGPQNNNRAPVVVPQRSDSINLEDVMEEPWSDETHRRIREDIHLHVNGGVAVHDGGPQLSNSSAGSVAPVTDPAIVQGATTVPLSSNPLGNTQPLSANIQSIESHAAQEAPHAVPGPTDNNSTGNITSLASLKDKLHVVNGTLCTFNIKEGQTSTGAPPVTTAPVSPHTVPPTVSWKSIVVGNTPAPNPFINSTSSITFNEDGSANIAPSREFILHARKNWDSSCIGYFLGGAFAFSFIKDHAFKLWKNKGLLKVFYSSKGYFTFKFNNSDSMRQVLELHSVHIGGKPMFLVPWMEGSKFKKNIITKVPCWIKLVDVPHSYWTAEGLTLIAKAVGKPLKFDNPTSKLDPMKYASVQVELEYSAPRPDFAWVPVIDCDGLEEKVKVQIIYPQLPYSCSLCKAFGHSLARCRDNPDAAPLPTKRNFNKGESSKANSQANKKQFHTKGTQEAPKNDVNEKQGSSEAPNNTLALSTVVIGEFLGCDMVLDDDEDLATKERDLEQEALEKQREEDQNCEEALGEAFEQDDDLNDFDVQNNNDVAGNVEDSVRNMMGDDLAVDCTVAPIAIANPFESLADMEEGELSPPPSVKKVKNSGKKVKFSDRTLVYGLAAAPRPQAFEAPLEAQPQTSNNSDNDSRSTSKAPIKKSSRLAGKPAKNLSV